MIVNLDNESFRCNIEKPINAIVNRALPPSYLYLFFLFLFYKEKQNAKRLLRYATKRFLMTLPLLISRNGTTSEGEGIEYNKNVINDFCKGIIYENT